MSPLDWDVWGEQYPEPALPGDRDAILDLVVAGEGKESAEVAGRWWQKQPEAFFVIRCHDGAIGGFLTLLDLTRASSDDIAADPGAAAAWDYAQHQAPPRPTEIVTQSRFIIDRDVYQGPSQTLNAVPILTMQRYLASANLAWDFLALADPEQWDEYFAAPSCREPLALISGWVIADTGCSCTTSDRSRQRPAGAGDRARVVQDVSPSPSPPSVAAPLLGSPSRSSTTRCGRRCVTFADPSSWPATRCCGPVLSGTEHGTKNQLQPRSRRSSATPSGPCASIRATTSGGGPSSAPTYILPAARSGPPRRWACRSHVPWHLTQGVDRVVAWLWDQEVYGPVAVSSTE